MGLGRGIKELWLSKSGSCEGGEGEAGRVGGMGPREEDVKAVLDALGRLLGER